MRFPKLYCKGVPYRAGFVEVSPNIHPGHINLEIWNLDPDHDQRVTDIGDDCSVDTDVTGNTEIELDLAQAKELVRLLGMAIDAVERR